MKSRSRFFDAVFVFAFLTLVYSFFYSGTFLTDDEHILASRALSFAFDGDFNNSRVLGNNRVFEYSIVPEPWANQALKIEPVQAVAGGVLALISTVLNLGHIQVMFLLNIWVTAATAALLYLSAAKMGFSRKVSFFVAALFGLGTIAMPYARTFFRDPLAMLFLAAAWYLMLVIKQANRVEQKDTLKIIAAWVAFIACFLAGVLSKNSVVLALPIMLLELVLNHPRRGSGAKANKNFKDWLVPLLIFAGLVLCWFLIVPSIPMLTRFSPDYYLSVLQKFLTTPRTGFLQALIGPFVSPGKSIFVFSPVLLLSMWSLITRFRTSWSAWIYLVLLVIFQALFYDAEWAGHVNWGLRYILPAIPLLVLASAPTIEVLLKKRAGPAVLLGLLTLACLIQILGSVVPVRLFFVDSLYGANPVTESTTVWNAKASILPWSLKWILAAKPLDLAIYRNPFVLWVMIPSAILIILLAITGLRSIKTKWMAVAALVVTVILNFSMIAFYRNDPSYAYTRADFRMAQEHIRGQFQTGDLVLVKSYSEDLWNFWMNWGDASIPWTALPVVPPYIPQGPNPEITGDPEFMMDKITLWVFKNQLPDGRRVWLIGDETKDTQNYDADAVWLKLHLIGSDCLWFTEDQSATRVCLFVHD